MFLSVSFLCSLLSILFLRIPSSCHNLEFNINAQRISVNKDFSLTSALTVCSPAIFPSPTSVSVRYRQKYQKRRFSYGCNHPCSYNLAVITNQEAHMIYGNMDQQQGSTEKNKSKKSRPGSTQITDFFSKASNPGELSINVF